MSASTPMRTLWSFGHKPHPVDTKRYGQPRLAFYWASPSERFTYPGVHVWCFGRHWRVLPLRRRVNA